MTIAVVSAVILPLLAACAADPGSVNEARAGASAAPSAHSAVLPSPPPTTGPSATPSGTLSGTLSGPERSGARSLTGAPKDIQERELAIDPTPDSATPVPPASAAGSLTATIPRSPTCGRPAPTTPAGYQRALAELPAAEWGAADLSLSVPMPDGRVVWLYGDTVTGTDSRHLTSFVHSSAVVQDGGCFHVSRHGAQVLPDDSLSVVSWISAAVALDATHLLVATGQQQLTGDCALCFRSVGVRAAVLTLNSHGDVGFQRWLTRWAPAGGVGGVNWGAGMSRDARNITVYGISRTGYARDVYAATVPVAGVLHATGWEFGSRPIATGIDPAGVSAWHDAAGWHFTTARGGTVVRYDTSAGLDRSRTQPAAYTSAAVGVLPAPRPRQLLYYAAAHPEAHLTGGGLLVTICRNWLSNDQHSIASYRPLYLSARR
ncbi:hypothetical protein M6D93_14650 [Jatrophihabitans telluris]|uniref:Uncharacterized protein n=1 Tax=Jatrophihabitans telluris TaxID=2038343 RepID=A0ABY4QWK9_9ACTN|nr:hypothetical protein [Jatrophihabitans telluris]UQX87532.1 hypothetical protein M6D93_14650 [Jatrophihabitans telluris]